MARERRVAVSFLASVATILVASGSAARAQATQQIEVRGYGAIPDDGQNDLPGIQAAIAAIPQTPAGSPPPATWYELIFEAGVYDITPTSAPIPLPGNPGQHSLFWVPLRPNLTIQGNGATLLCHGFNPTLPHNASYFHLFEFNQCDGLIVQDLTVSMSRRPYSEGGCTEVVGLPSQPQRQNRYFKVDLTTFLQDDPTGTAITIDMLTHYEAGKTYPNGFVFFHWDEHPPLNSILDFTRMGVQEGVVKIQGNKRTAQGIKLQDGLKDPSAFSPTQDYGKLQVGDRVVVVHQFHGYIAFSLAECDGATISNVTVHTYAGQAVNATRLDDLTIDALTVIPDPSWTEGFMTTTSDAIHMRDVGGTLTITGCHLQGMADDGINFYTHFRKVASFDANNKWIDLDQPCSPPCQLAAGQSFEFYDANLVALGTRVVTSIQTPSPSGKPHRVFFDATLPTTATIDQVANLAWFPQTASISACTVQGSRGVGIRLHRDTIVNGCSFVETTSGGLVAEPNLGLFGEGPTTRSVTISGCTLTRTNRGFGFGGLFEGSINLIGLDARTAPWKAMPMGSSIAPVADTLIEGCTILDSGGSVLAVRSADGIEINECSFGSAGSLGYLLPTTSNTLGRYPAESLLFFHEARNLIVSYNTLLPGSTIVFGDRLLAPWSNYSKTGNTGF